MVKKRKNKNTDQRLVTAKEPAVSSTFDTPVVSGEKLPPNAATNSSSVTTVKKRARIPSFYELFEYLMLGLVWIALLSPVLIPVIGLTVYVPCYRASLKPAEFTVDRRERVTKASGDSVQSYFLVWSREGEVFCVSDTWSFLKFDASDRYGKLREGRHIHAKVAGWRFPFLSWYRNIVVIESVDEPTP